MTHRGPFQPLPFCDSVTVSELWPDITPSMDPCRTAATRSLLEGETGLCRSNWGTAGWASREVSKAHITCRL